VTDPAAAVEDVREGEEMRGGENPSARADIAEELTATGPAAAAAWVAVAGMLSVGMEIVATVSEDTGIEVMPGLTAATTEASLKGHCQPCFSQSTETQRHRDPSALLQLL
jgi:hypothetical protein